MSSPAVSYDGSVTRRQRIQGKDLPEHWARLKAAFDAFYQNADLYAFEFEPLHDPIPASVLPTFVVDERLDEKTVEELGRDEPNLADLTSSSPPGSFHFPTTLDYHRAYLSHTTTPTDVALRVLQLIRESDTATPPLRAFVELKDDLTLEMARASTERYKQGKPLSVFDGVPVGVKDTHYVTGFTWSYGIEDRQKGEDLEFIAQLKSLGAVIIGITVSTETANTDFGPNPVYGTPRNPYKAGHVTGGSSAGTGVAVAAGFTPFSAGSDGAGSIRTPAGWCGVFGLKTTWARVQLTSSPHSVSGPLAGTAADLAIAHKAMSVQLIPAAPPASVRLFDKVEDLKDLRIGIFREWFADANKEVVDAGLDLLEGLKKRGATIVDLPLTFSVKAAVAAHRLTFGGAMRNTFMNRLGKGMYDGIKDQSTRLEFLRQHILTSDADYLQSMKIKTIVAGAFKEAFKSVDGIIFPGTTCPAPKVEEFDAVYGKDDPETEQRFSPFVPIANFIGVPSVSVPSGYSEADGLPLSVQFYGSWWREDVLLRIAHASEKVLESGILKAAKEGRKKPEFWVDVLGKSK
ncbi:amidase signature enzyme [Gonapodya prolifera JEL478]|uniref:Amidase signature enzyme n=1 Tax=Gonapodya prolifera (strain JEL478) TaxID=1344416 RepID=A0A139ARB6_GONPJ|nr:amidase signature enzyme [Gonapodya prolifera JEL478]|eukprot:KXS19290.1 amidase signature enzyme [Gonapodya prolifera JEL478]